MNLIDTHAHLYQEDFENDLELVIQKARDAGIQKILVPNVDRASMAGLERVCKAYPRYCLPMMGLHPTSVKEDWKDELEAIRVQLFDAPFSKWVAVGEIGMDLYWDQTFVKEQEKAFIQQLEWALQLDLPVAIHSRNAFEPIMQVLKAFDTIKGVFHCFSGDVRQAREVVDKGLLLGIGGVVTFKKNELIQVVEAMELTDMVLETDAPYLAPVPHRGKRNESAYVALVAQKISEIKGVPVDEVAKITTHNAKKLFNLAE